MNDPASEIPGGIFFVGEFLISDLFGYICRI